jgi:ribosome-binding ATPase YchF (GTP1/OBG family)
MISNHTEHVLANAEEIDASRLEKGEALLKHLQAAEERAEIKKAEHFRNVAAHAHEMNTKHSANIALNIEKNHQHEEIKQRLHSSVHEHLEHQQRIVVSIESEIDKKLASAAERRHEIEKQKDVNEQNDYQKHLEEEYRAAKHHEEFVKQKIAKAARK